MTVTFSYFPCEFTPLLAALGSMGAVEQHVYLIILLRIYESGGVCRDTVDALSMRTRHSKRAVRSAIANLTGSGRLVDDGSGGFSNPKADAVIAKILAYRNQKTAIGFLGGKKTQQNQQNRQAGASHLNRKEEKKEERVPPVGPPRGTRPPAKTRLPTDFRLTDSMRSYAEQHGLAWAEAIFAAFCDHHRARGNVMVDWVAAWRTWVRNEVKFNRPRINGVRHDIPRPGSKEDTRERTQAALAAFAPHDGTYDVRTGPRAREPLSEILPFPQLGKP